MGTKWHKLTQKIGKISGYLFGSTVQFFALYPGPSHQSVAEKGRGQVRSRGKTRLFPNKYLKAARGAALSSIPHHNDEYGMLNYTRNAKPLRLDTVA